VKILTEWIIKTLLLLVTAYLVPGFKIDSYATAFVVALVLGILNMFVKPVLVFFTLPATILTLGLFLFVINALLLMLAASIIQGFQIESFGTAIIASIVITILSTLLNSVFK